VKLHDVVAGKRVVVFGLPGQSVRRPGSHLAVERLVCREGRVCPKLCPSPAVARCLHERVLQQARAAVQRAC
jgi:hypothetical protein